MQPNKHAGLLALNAALLAGLAIVTLAPHADAQRSRKDTRNRGEYTMVSGEIQGRAEAAIYIIDAANEELVAVRWDQSRQTLTPLGFRDISEDRKTGGAGR